MAMGDLHLKTSNSVEKYLFIPSLNATLLQSIASFVALYIGRSPKLDEIKLYIELVLQEKRIVESYNAKLITQDEVCSFLLAHIYTQFVAHEKSICEVSKDKIEEIARNIRTLLFQ